ncbi:hypothetical protein CEXT_735351 [Caerostris extrusa]|uniref:Uncharacterized protein n=1 Tax=Caerostris extrusa TaxID=172846 RepID=A0AAV4Y9G1_CAEEX|nr:hypothetical protein CEXT_735351 [Caerostris extrusa]
MNSNQHPNVSGPQTFTIKPGQDNHQQVRQATTSQPSFKSNEISARVEATATSGCRESICRRGVRMTSYGFFRECPDYPMTDACTLSSRPL